MDVLGCNFISGEWRSASGQPYSSENPATGQIIWSGRESTLRDINEAIEAARAASRDWLMQPIAEKNHIVESFAQKLTEHKEALAITICREVGKPLWEARTEVQAMIGKIPDSIQAMKERRTESAFGKCGNYGLTRYKPHGVLTVFGPFNFPGHVSNGQIVPALLAGNTVVFKPSELTALVAEQMVKLWEESGLPAGVLNLVQGGRSTGETIVSHPGHNGVLFTGSMKTGLSISRALVDRPEVIVALELGGNNPLVVHDVNNIDAAVYVTIQSAYLTSGQRCTCARRLIVPDGNQAFLDRLVEIVSQIVVGPPEGEPGPLMGPLIQAGAVDALLDEQQRLIASGGRVLVEAKRLSQRDTFVSPGLIDVTDVTDRRDEEVFGPLLQLIRVPNFATAISEANHTRYGLVAGLLCDHRNLYEQFYGEVDAGLINWNSPTTGASGRLPFGGTGRSGNHRPAGYFMIDACNVPIASLERDTLTLPEHLLPGITLS